MKLVTSWLGKNLISILTLSIVVAQGVYGFGQDKGTFDGLKAKVDALDSVVVAIRMSEWKLAALEAALIQLKEERAELRKSIDRLVDKHEETSEQLNQLIGELKKRR